MSAPIFALIKRVFPAVLALCLMMPFFAQANSGGASGPEPLIFTVNIGDSKYLQVEMVFEPASPESGALLATYKPKIQHEIILLLAEEKLDHLRSREGKLELMEKVVEKVNEVIDESHKTGIHEVYFTKFIIQ